MSNNEKYIGPITNSYGGGRADGYRNIGRAHWELLRQAETGRRSKGSASWPQYTKAGTRSVGS